jgi:glycosyltransferase involved in cell wall biosynthesis
MRILHIIPNLRKGGAERLAIDICAQLSARSGISVCLLTFSDENEYADIMPGLRHVVAKASLRLSVSGSNAADIDDLYSFISEFRPDVIHSHLFAADLIARWKPIPGVKYFSHCHDNMRQLRRFRLSDLTSKQRLTEIYERYVACRLYSSTGNTFIAISGHAQKYFKLQLPKPLAKKVKLLHNAIRYSRFYCDRQPQQELVIINTGSFVPKKNQSLAVQTVKELLSRGIKCRAVFLGDGPMRKDLMESASNSGLGAYFDFPGNVADVEKWLSKATVYLHTATYEPFGLVLLEAMASGLPVVCLNGGGNADIIENGKNGYILSKAGAEQLASKIWDIWADKELYNNMSSYAQQYASGFDISSYADKLLDIYRGS